MRIRSRWGVAVALGLAVVGYDATARACSCIGTQVVIPSAKTHVPLNTRIVVLSGSDRVMLRRKGGARVPTTLTRVGTGSDPAIILSPKQNLQPLTVYQVRIRSGKRWSAAKEFTTGRTVDKANPKWKGIASAFYSGKVRPGLIRSTCTVGGVATIKVKLKGSATDLNTPGEDVLYMVWVGKASRRIDFTKAPQGMAREWVDGAGKKRGMLLIGRRGICELDLVSVPIRSSIRLGLRPVDPSGNLGKPVELKLPATHRY